MNIAVLFPTLLGITQADPLTIAHINAEVAQREDLINSLLTPSWGDNVLTTFNLEKHLFAAARLDHLRRFIENGIMEFVRETRQVQDLRFDDDYTQSWMNITRKFGFQERHNHDMNGDGLPISGAYYFNTNGADGDLAIFPPDAQYKQFGNHVVEPAIGKLVLFRSEVFHRVAANLTDNDRISFSFNYLLVKN